MATSRTCIRFLLFSLSLFVVLILAPDQISRAGADRQGAHFADAPGMGQAPATGQMPELLKAAHRPESLPAFLRATTPWRSASPLVRHLFQADPQAFSAGASPALLTEGEQAPTERPQLNAERLFDAPHFRIHYAAFGRHAPPPGDRNDNGVPDYVEAVAAAAEDSREILVERLHWPSPLPDGDRGGDERTDIYLSDLAGGFLGYTHPDPDHCGNNPLTPQEEVTGCSAYLALDNDMEGYSSERMDPVRITIAHEFMHVLQYGIDSSEPADWLWEAWAVWAEEQVFDEINAYYGLLPELFNAPDAPLDEHPYAAVLLPLWISEQLSPAIVRDAWLQAIRYDGMAALEAALRQHGILPFLAMLNYQAALVVRYPCPQVAPFCWEEGASFPTVRLEGELKSPSTWSSQVQGNRRLSAYGIDVIRLTMDTPSYVVMRSQDIAHLVLQVVVIPENKRRRVTVLRGTPSDKGVNIFLSGFDGKAQYLAVVSAPLGEPRAGYALHLEPAEIITPTPAASRQIFLPRIERF